MVAFLKEQKGRKKVDEMISNFPLKFLPSRKLSKLWAPWTFPLCKTALTVAGSKEKPGQSTGDVPREKRSAKAWLRGPRQKLRGHLPWAVLLLLNMVQNLDVKAMAADDGHDADHVHLVVFSFTADITPIGVLLATKMFPGSFLCW